MLTAMLLMMVRLLFVILAVLVGQGSGAQIYGSALPEWFGAAMGFGVSITLIAAEQAFRRRFTRSLVGVLIGLAGGLLLGMALVLALRVTMEDQALLRQIDLPLVLVSCYLVLMTVLRNVDRWRVVLPFVELRQEARDGGAAVLDTALLPDGRLPALLRSGLLAERLLVHQSSISYWEGEAASDEAPRRARGARALDGLRDIRGLGTARVEIDETEIPQPSDRTDVLLRLCRLEGARLVTADREVRRRAEALGVAVLDLAQIAEALRTELRPGDVIEVLIEKAGDGRDQGVGHLDDGSLVVVTAAAGRVGERLRVTVLRTHPTANGRMVFAE